MEHNSTDLLTLGTRFLAENGEADGKLLFLMDAQQIWNSTATPTNMKYQEIVLKKFPKLNPSRVYLAPLDKEISLFTSKDTFTAGQTVQMHEIKKFCEMLIRGRPGMIEMLFVDETDPNKVYESEEWKGLKQIRNSFLNKLSAQNFLGSARGSGKPFEMQLIKKKKMANNNKFLDEQKVAYCLIWRMLFEFEDVVNQRPIRLTLNEDEQTILAPISDNKYSLEELVDMTKKKIDGFDEQYKDKIYWEDKDFEAVANDTNKWLLSVRHAQLDQSNKK